MTTRDIMAIIPAYNEEEFLGATLEGLLGLLSPDQILVVDDASMDRTTQVAKEKGVKILSLPRNRGKGGALLAGIRGVKKEVLLFLDADLGSSSKEAYLLWEPILSQRAEATIGVLPRPRQKGGLGLARFVAREGIRILTGEKFAGVLSGQRAFQRGVIQRLLPFAPGFGLEVGLTLDMVRQKISYQEVEVEFYHRETLNDWKGFCHRGRQLLHIIRAFQLKG